MSHAFDDVDDFQTTVPASFYEDYEPGPCPYGGPRCACCGCCQHDPCPGGCVWATSTLCSACVLEAGL
jgi:hypothetical protein